MTTLRKHSLDGREIKGRIIMYNLELEKLFSIAISREIEAYEFYKKVTEIATNLAVKDLFKQLAKEEMHHMEILEEFKADPTKMMNINAPKTDTKVAEATELPSLSADMKPADAIALAMKKEQEAVEFYRNLGKQCTSSESCRFFENLAKMELTHKQILENLFVEIGYPEVF